MILVLRGHIRESFNSNNLYDFIHKIYDLYPDLKIFIHTWNIFSSSVSWRKINHNCQIVNKEIINNYFGDLKHLIHHIIIDDDTKIQLIGNLCGKINNGLMPIIGWKNYWYGKHKIINFINNAVYINKSEMVINCRLDILYNSNSGIDTNIIDFIQKYCNHDIGTNIIDFIKRNSGQDISTRIINFIKRNNDKIFTKNVFIYDKECFGIDNIYIGNIDTMYKLSYIFVHNLDNILNIHNDTIHQEYLVYRINSILFN